MKPVTLRTRRLVLDQPTSSDRDGIVEYCQDPVFEHFMTLPWPYEPKHADYFTEQLVPQGWASGNELTWALREQANGPLLGALGWRAAGNDIGYWLGAPHRGNGYMAEAVIAVADYLFETIGIATINWECVAGNLPSVGVARAAGFRYMGESPAALTFRDGSHPMAWHGVLSPDDRGSTAAWPPSTS